MSTKPFEDDAYAKIVREMTASAEKMGQRPPPVVDLGQVRIGTTGVAEASASMLEMVEKSALKARFLYQRARPLGAPAEGLPLAVEPESDSEVSGIEGAQPPEGSAPAPHAQSQAGIRVPVGKKGDLKPNSFLGFPSLLEGGTLEGMADRFIATRGEPRIIK
jgi:hypothetical protein